MQAREMRVDWCRLPEGRMIVKAAVTKENLSKSEEAHLSALATILSVNRSIVKLTAEQLQSFASEVTSPRRLQSFNPIDLTTMYSTLVRLGVR